MKNYIIRLTNYWDGDIIYLKAGEEAMKKSVYSLVLMDDVIKAVDRQAYLLGTSRSNLINQILAEHLSCVTPEMRMREIFESLSHLAGGGFRIQQQRSASLMTLKTALDYKYRPTISYKVELEREPVDRLGTLRVQIRTQSEQLTELFNSFFAYRIKLETTLLKAHGRTDMEFQLTSGCFTRKLLKSSIADEMAGEAISRYLTHLNKSVQTYFSAPQELAEYAPAMENEYMAMLERYIL